MAGPTWDCSTIFFGTDKVLNDLRGLYNNRTAQGYIPVQSMLRLHGVVVGLEGMEQALKATGVDVKLAQAEVHDASSEDNYSYMDDEDVDNDVAAETYNEDN